jgi:protein-S-isoprenylcysteine O-methyltransferase Ste14
MIAGFWPDSAIYIPWDIWIVTWIAAALWTGRTIKRPGIGREWLYRVLSLAGFVLLLVWSDKDTFGHMHGPPMPGWLGERFWMPPLTVGWAMVALAAAGFLFAWWARIHLGRLWSGSITRKEGHRVVDSGPYAIVRHPIYTGILTAAIATVVVRGTGHVILGAVLLIAAYWMKAKIEERFLRDELGPEAYDSYRRRVPMLIPFGPK